jgi:hypothetical protein
VSGQYGIFRDELYYWACARRLAWGYVDHPPLSILILRVFGGDQLWQMKVPAAASFALAVNLTTRQAIAMGAGAWGSALTVIAMILCPLLLAVAGVFSMNVLEIAFWAAASTITTRLLLQPSPTLWWWLGAIIGLGTLNKYSMLLFPVGFMVGLLLTRARSQLFTTGPWVAGVIATVLVAPHLVWQFTHGWPSLEFLRNATTLKLASIGPFAFIMEQLLVTNPVLALFWLCGLLGLLFSPSLAVWRPHGMAFLVSAVILMASGNSRAAYLAPSYVLLLPAAGATFERLIPRHAVRSRALVLVLLLLAGLVTLPLALPILPVEQLVAYQRALGFSPRAEERVALGPLPQHMADRFGWSEMAAAMERAYHRLPPDEQRRTWIFTRNYGEAAAMEYFSPLLRDRVMSGHNSYSLWFPGEWDGSQVLVIGDSREDVGKAFREVTQVGETDHPFAMPYERHLPIYLGRQPTQTVAVVREAIKHYD